MTDLIKEVLMNTGLKEGDIKYIIAHQANSRIIEQAARSSGIPLEKFYMNVDKYGNTSAATIGIAIDEMTENHLLQPGDKIILIGFGGGLTSGAILVEWY
jgi:3-oxoacyl-[acyl-carrier-protein] synthase-3